MSIFLKYAVIRGILRKISAIWKGGHESQYQSLVYTIRHIVGYIVGVSFILDCEDFLKVLLYVTSQKLLNSKQPLYMTAVKGCWFCIQLTTWSAVDQHILW